MLHPSGFVALACFVHCIAAYKPIYAPQQQVHYVPATAYGGFGPNNHHGLHGPAKASSAFQIVNEWKYLDFEYPTYGQRQKAIANR